MVDAICPECGAEAADESVVQRRLSDLGYQHEDITYDCSKCDNRWQRGVPRGKPSDDTWVCGACGGDFIPHFVYVYHDENEARIRPKCQDCHWVPDEPIVLDTSTAEATTRLFIGHHAVTGERDDAQSNHL